MAKDEKGDKGQQVLKKLIERSPADIAKVQTPENLQRYLRGEVTIAELAGISGPELLEMAVVGFRMYQQGKLEEAKVVFQGLASLEPREAYFATALGAIYLAQEDLQQARKYFDVAIKLNPKDVSAHVNRGEVFLRMGNMDEAAQDFARVLDLDPQSKDPLTARARALVQATHETMTLAQRVYQKHGTVTPELMEQESAASRAASGKTGARSVPTGARSVPTGARAVPTGAHSVPKGAKKK